jgi:hypothetical protein
MLPTSLNQSVFSLLSAGAKYFPSARGAAGQDVMGEGMYFSRSLATLTSFLGRDTPYRTQQKLSLYLVSASPGTTEVATPDMVKWPRDRMDPTSDERATEKRLARGICAVEFFGQALRKKFHHELCVLGMSEEALQAKVVPYGYVFGHDVYGKSARSQRKRAARKRAARKRSR